MLLVTAISKAGWYHEASVNSIAASRSLSAMMDVISVILSWYRVARSSVRLSSSYLDSVFIISVGFPLVDNLSLVSLPVVENRTLDLRVFWDGLSNTSVIQSNVPSGLVTRILFMYPYRRASESIRRSL